MSAFNRTLTAGMLGAVLAAGVALATPATVTGQAHPQVSVWPRGGVDVGGVAYGCWVEKATSQDTAEAICGPVDLRPAGSLSLGDEITVNGVVWVATMAGLEPVEEV